MASIDYNQVTDGAAHPAIGPVQPEVSDLVGIARRGWLFIVAGTIFGLVCALVVLSTMPPVYKASSRIAFERTLPRYMQTNKVSNEPIIDDYDTLGQTYVISSENIMLQAIRSLSLASDPDFVGRPDSQSLGSRVRGLLRNVAETLGYPKETAENQSTDPEKIALGNVARNLTVNREDVASVMTIAFSSSDPAKAAAIVNAIVDTYVADTIAGKMKSTNVAGKVVQERVEELKQQAKDAERAVLEYKMANNLVGSGTTTLSGEQLATLQTHMTNARVAMAEARARMERIAKDPDASALFAPDNELISRLRSELLDLSVRANDIESRVGKGHLAAVKVRNRMEEVREAIAAEQKRVAGSFGKNYELARAQYDELSAAMSRAMGEEGANSDAKARMRELESAADTLRSLYNQALQQFSQMNRVDAQPAITPDVRVLMRASPPSQTEVLEEAMADPGRRVGDRVALGSRFRIGQELSVWRFQNLPASDSRDWAALRCPPGTLRCRRAGLLEDRRIRVELALFAIFSDPAQYLGHDQYRTEGIRFEGRLRRLLKPWRRQDDCRHQSRGAFRPAFEHARPCHRCRLPSPVADEQSGS